MARLTRTQLMMANAYIRSLSLDERRDLMESFADAYPETFAMLLDTAQSLEVLR